MRKFKLTKVQAAAILDMQLRRLAAMERSKLKKEKIECSLSLPRGGFGLRLWDRCPKKRGGLCAQRKGISQAAVDRQIYAAGQRRQGNAIVGGITHWQRDR
jgi:hypothetical protein